MPPAPLLLLHVKKGKRAPTHVWYLAANEGLDSWGGLEVIHLYPYPDKAQTQSLLQISGRTTTAWKKRTDNPFIGQSQGQ